ncbi:MAG TPA: hypothetical protein VMP67_10430 [Candidatus Limnocylindria bacterium]|nr:hypothetical protein [Candidatus Limnocylindria bacterium]
MRQSSGYGRGLLPAILLVFYGCAAGPAAQEPTPPATAAPPPPTAAATVAPTAEPTPTHEPTEAPAATATPVSQNPDDYYGPGDGGGTATTTPAAGEPTVAVTNSANHESFLVGPNGFALYTFTQDSPGASNCSGSCADAWPPLTVAMGESPAGGPGVTGALATIERDDGTWQVTYDDAPLYYFAADTAAGDTTGHEVGGVWFLATP